MSAALLVIDVQESFRHTTYWQADDLDAYLRQQNKLIAGCREAGLPIVRVFHVDIDGNPAFAQDSGHITPLAGSDTQADHTVIKHVHSAMIGTNLDAWLKAQGIHHLIISGIRTEQCCETTTRNASDMGYTVDYVTEATMTFPMRHAHGRIYSPAEIKERTELVLAGRFATVRSVDDVLSQLPLTA